MYTAQYASRNRKLAKLGMTYEQYLKSPTWQLVRILAARKPKFQICCACGSKENLQLHHNSYSRIHKIGRIEFQLHHLFAVCGDCHIGIHGIAKEKRIGLKKATKMFIKRKQKEETSSG